MVSSLLTERTVRTVIAATTQGQSTADSIETGIRSSSAFKITSENAGADQMLSARVAKGTAATVAWSCVAWYYSASDKSIRYKQATVAIPAPSAAALSSWTLLVSDIKPTTGTKIFDTADPKVVKLDFQAQVKDHLPASISTSAVSRAEVWESDACFSLG
jgi:hypothetical protein